MELHFKQYRNEFSKDTTLSGLVLGIEPLCHILEDTDRGLRQSMTEEETKKIKVYGETAIGYGTYQVVITYSNKFGIYYPLYLGTVGYVGIRFHCGVNEFHTHGCLLPGMKRVKDGLQRSNEAFDLVFGKMLAHKTDEKTGIELLDIHKEFRRERTKGKTIAQLKPLSDQFGKIYHPKSNANSITWTIERATQNVIQH